MSALSKWMIAYGLLLIGCEIADWITPGRIMLDAGAWISGWTVGLLMIASGIASSQGRRSLRITGYYVGTLLPLTVAAIFLWNAYDLWRSGAVHTQPGFLAIVAVLSIAVTCLVVRTRPRDGIASRGYAVTIPKPISPATPTDNLGKTS